MNAFDLGRQSGLVKEAVGPVAAHVAAQGAIGGAGAGMGAGLGSAVSGLASKAKAFAGTGAGRAGLLGLGLAMFGPSLYYGAKNLLNGGAGIPGSYQSQMHDPYMQRAHQAGQVNKYWSSRLQALNGAHQPAPNPWGNS